MSDPGLEWVSCSEDEFGSVGANRHIVSANYRSRHWVTTSCGHTANVPGIWRKNSSKAKCPRCAELHPDA